MPACLRAVACHENGPLYAHASNALFARRLQHPLPASTHAGGYVGPALVRVGRKRRIRLDQLLDEQVEDVQVDPPPENPVDAGGFGSTAQPRTRCSTLARSARGGGSGGREAAVGRDCEPAG